MTDSNLKIKVQEDMKSAMRAQEKERLGTIRMLLAAIKQVEIDKQITLDDAQALGVIEKMIKQRRDAIEQYQQAGRDELAAKEAAEIKILQAYLPKQLDEAEITQLIKQAIAETGAASMRDMGKVMAIIKPKAQGRVDMGKISAIIKDMLL